MVRFILTAAAVAVCALPGALSAQDDVVQLGRIYGTTPPASYFREVARNPRAFQLSRGWQRRNPRLRVVERGGGRPPTVELRTREASGGPGEPTAASRAPGASSVEGTILFPLLLGYFADQPAPPPFTRAGVQAEFFDGPNSRYRTITEFYDELSGGRVTLSGRTEDWARSNLTQAQVTGGVSGLGSPGRVGEFIHDLLAAADDGSVDWGLYDNDGPDGVPNSGDDDGWVDLLAVMHPTHGAECGSGGSNRIWSHKWTLSSASAGSGKSFYTTSSPSANGGNVRVEDYTIQPVYSCNATSINEIGVFAHELGHGLGLPDLYCTSGFCGHQGVGRWDLMGSGSWGCRAPNDPARPCHMGAWSKTMLGWVDLEVLAPGQDHGTVVLEPVETSGRVLRADLQDAPGEYFLIENRQRLGFDQSLFAPGLLVWHIDEPWIVQRWPSNSVNNTAGHLGVWLREADGLDNLRATGAASNRGDAGDPFPGSTGATAFHVATTPSATGHGGDVSGLTLLDIAPAGTDVAFRALTRLQTVTLRTEGETTGGLLAVDGAALPGTIATFESAPFQSHVIEAAAGEPLGPGRRRGFDAWTDDAAAPRVRTVQTGLEDAEFVARYGQQQLEVRVTLDGGQFGVEPGTIVSTPASEDLWFAEGTQVTLRAEATPGFRFDGWSGALAGSPNPVGLTVTEPVTAGASFSLVYGLPARVDVVLEAASPPTVQLVAPEGTAPFAWDVTGGTLPEGVALLLDGRLTGSPLATGTFDVQVRVRDGRGLEATGQLRIEVTPPEVPLATLAGPFMATGVEPTFEQRSFFDRIGNRNGAYDLGDLRAFLRAYPNLAAARAASRGEIVIPLAPVGRGGGR